MEDDLNIVYKSTNVIRIVCKERKDRVVRPRPNYFEIWDEKEFIARLRSDYLSKLFPRFLKIMRTF